MSKQDSVTKARNELGLPQRLINNLNVDGARLEVVKRLEPLPDDSYITLAQAEVYLDLSRQVITKKRKKEWGGKEGKDWRAIRSSGSHHHPKIEYRMSFMLLVKQILRESEEAKEDSKELHASARKSIQFPSLDALCEAHACLLRNGKIVKFVSARVTPEALKLLREKGLTMQFLPAIEAVQMPWEDHRLHIAFCQEVEEVLHKYELIVQVYREQASLRRILG